MNRFWAKFWPIIALAFPVLELVGIYQLWQVWGAWTLLWLGAAAGAGLLLILTERAAFPHRLMHSLMRAEDVRAPIFQSGARVLAAVLLIFPGAASDLVAVGLLLHSLVWVRGLRVRRASPPPGVIEGKFRRLD